MPYIKTGDVAAGVAGWTQRVCELDKHAAAVQTPPAQRRTTVMKFDRRAASESRTFDKKGSEEAVKPPVVTRQVLRGQTEQSGQSGQTVQMSGQHHQQASTQFSQVSQSSERRIFQSGQQMVQLSGQQ